MTGSEDTSAAAAATNTGAPSIIDENAKRYGVAWDGLMGAFKQLSPEQQRLAAENLFRMSAGEVSALLGATRVTGTNRVYTDGSSEFTFEMSRAPLRRKQ